jgi:hypothetical protein
MLRSAVFTFADLEAETAFECIGRKADNEVLVGDSGVELDGHPAPGEMLPLDDLGHAGLAGAGRALQNDEAAAQKDLPAALVGVEVEEGPDDQSGQVPVFAGDPCDAVEEFTVALEGPLEARKASARPMPAKGTPSAVREAVLREAARSSLGAPPVEANPRASRTMVVSRCREW